VAGYALSRGLITLQDYMRCSSRLDTVMSAHVEALLRAGLSVVLDFPANTVDTRNWMKAIFVRAPDAERKRRLRLRNASGEHEFSPTAADFDEFTRYFVPPAPEEGFNVVTIRTPVA
jgi:hypothetical protein